MNIQQRIEDYVELAHTQVDKIEEVLTKTTSRRTEDRYVKQLLFYEGVIALGNHLLDELKIPAKMLQPPRI